MIYEILTNDDPVLHQRSEEVKDFEAVKIIAANMLETLSRSTGIALAAPQVGLNLRLAVFNTSKVGGKLRNVIMVNPVITFKDKKMIKSIEGCLSMPGISCQVTRSDTVQVTYYTVTGTKAVALLSSIDSRCAQHEIDHLDGITMNMVGTTL